MEAVSDGKRPKSMKNLLLFCCLFGSTSLFAQTQGTLPTNARTIFIGGTASIDISENTNRSGFLANQQPFFLLPSASNVESYNFNFLPYVGKDINPKVALGLILRLGFGRLDQSGVTFIIPGGGTSVGNIRQTNRTLGGDVFLRYTLNPNNQLRFFLQPQIGYAATRSEISPTFDGSTVTQAWAVETSVQLGLLYEITPRFRATLRAGGLQYVRGRSEIEGFGGTQEDISTFNANFRLADLAFGVEFKL